MKTSYGSWQRGTGNLRTGLAIHWVWEARLRTAEDLEAEADRVEVELGLVRHETGTG